MTLYSFIVTPADIRIPKYNLLNTYNVLCMYVSWLIIWPCKPMAKTFLGTTAVVAILPCQIDYICN